MKVQSTPLEGLKIIELSLWKDPRGYFTERFSGQRFKEHGLPFEFLQDNHSRSFPKVLRGLHLQFNPAQGKLVGVIRGTIWDVAVDLRPDSPTLGKHFGLELSGDNGKLLWIPGGFAHGFCVIGEEPADVLYKVDAPYQPQSETGILWSDPDLNIPWPVTHPLISARDAQLSGFKQGLEFVRKNLPNGLRPLVQV